MVNHKMHVHLFKVTPIEGTTPLTVLLRQIQRDSLEDRLRTISNYQVRVEHVVPPHTGPNHTRFWLLDFIKLRFEHGPGKAGRNTPIVGFALNHDEGFGEETAVLYDPQSEYMIIQYNHHGVRSSAIQEYLSCYDHQQQQVQGYDLRIKLDESAEVRLAQKRLITKLHFKIAPPQITAAHRNANVGLGRALDFNDSYGSDEIEIVISSQRGNHLNFGATTRLINKLKDLVVDGEAAVNPIVKKFEVSGRDDPIGRTDAINMLVEKLELTIDQLQLGPDRRYTRASRWDGLLRAQRGWNQFLPN